VLGKRQIKPEEEVILKAVYQTQGRPGPYEKLIYLLTNSTVQPQVIIIIKGEVRPVPAAHINVVPRKINLGYVKKDSVKKINLKISNNGDQNLKITRIWGNAIKTIDGKNRGAMNVNPKESIIIETAFQTTLVGPFVEVFFIGSNARNALNGQYAVMVIGEGTP
jgi:hypothetical protein